MGRELLIFGLAFLVIFLAYVIISRSRERNPYQERISNLDRHRQRLDAEKLAGLNKGQGPKSRAYSRKGEEESAWRQLVNQLTYRSEEEKNKITRAFQMAGWHTENGLILYGIIKTASLVVFGFFTWVYVHFFLDLETMLEIGAVIGAALASSYSVSGWLKWAVNRRQKRIEKVFPDALDLMVICSEAGLSLNAIIARVAKDVGQIHPDLGYEMSLLAIELNMLSSRKEAMDNFSNRLQSQLCKNMVGSLLQSEQYGTPISQTMRTLAEEFRFDRLMTAEQRAAKLPVLMAAPLVLFIFPSLFVVILGPAIINVMAQFG